MWKKKKQSIERILLRSFLCLFVFFFHLVFLFPPLPLSSLPLLIKKFTSVFHASVLLLIMNFVIIREFKINDATAATTPQNLVT